MDDVIMKGVGAWLLIIVEAIMVFIAFWMGHLVNGLPPELFTLVSTVIAASQILVFLIIKKIFGITE